MEAKTGGGKDRGGDRSAAVRESVEAVGIGATAREYGAPPPATPTTHRGLTLREHATVYDAVIVRVALSTRSTLVP